MPINVANDLQDLTSVFNDRCDLLIGSIRNNELVICSMLLVGFMVSSWGCRETVYMILGKDRDLFPS